MSNTVRRASSRLLAGLLLVVLMSGCEATLFASDEEVDRAGEARYLGVWKEHSAAVGSINSSLDACNRGGTQEGCYHASERMIAALQTLLTKLRVTQVPSRFKEGDASARNAVAKMITGLQLRNAGIAANDTAAFVRGNASLKEANSLLEDAYDEFPPDARP